jgi:hypothetical protein
MRTLAAGRDLLVFDRDTQVVIEDRRTNPTPVAAPSPAPRPTPTPSKAVLPESTFQRALVALHEKEAREDADRNQARRVRQPPAEPAKPETVTPLVLPTAAPAATSSLNFAQEKGVREMADDHGKKGDGGGHTPQWLINGFLIVLAVGFAFFLFVWFGNSVDQLAKGGNGSGSLLVQREITALKAENDRVRRELERLRQPASRTPASGGRPQGYPQTTITADECEPGFTPTSYGTCRRYVPPTPIVRRYD